MESFDLAALVRPVGAEGAFATALPQAPEGANAAQIGAFVAAFLAEANAVPSGEVAGATAGTDTALDARAARPSAIPASLALPGRQDLTVGQTPPATDVAATGLHLATPREARGARETVVPATAPIARSAVELGDARAVERAAPEQRALASSLLRMQDFDQQATLTEDAADSNSRSVVRADAGVAEQRGNPALPAAESSMNLLALRTGGGEVVQGTYAGRPAALPMNDPALFGERLNHQIAIMVSQNNNQARIAVSPPELGPVEVRVTVVGDEAAIQLAATSPATREALEDALPRLRAAFADSGVALGDTGVFAELPDQRPQPRDGDAEQGGAAAAASSEAESADDTTPRLRQVSLALVDAFV